MSLLPELVVYTAQDCCLCDDAKALLGELAPALYLAVRYVDITGDAELETAWREQLPAGVFDGRKVFKYHVDAALLTRRVETWRRTHAVNEVTS